MCGFPRHFIQSEWFSDTTIIIIQTLTRYSIVLNVLKTSRARVGTIYARRRRASGEFTSSSVGHNPLQTSPCRCHPRRGGGNNETDKSRHHRRNIISGDETRLPPILISGWNRVGKQIFENRFEYYWSAAHGYGYYRVTIITVPRCQRPHGSEETVDPPRANLHATSCDGRAIRLHDVFGCKHNEFPILTRYTRFHS